MMSLWDALRMNMMISYQELVRTFPRRVAASPIPPLPAAHADEQLSNIAVKLTVTIPFVMQVFINSHS